MTVKGEKADPMKVFERLKKIYGKNVELISPIPNPKEPEEEKKEEIEEVSLSNYYYYYYF